MKVSEEFLEYVLDMLAPVGQVVSSRMFNGALLKVSGKQLGILFSETLYFKVTDPLLQQQYTEKGSHQFTYTRKDKEEPVVIKNWWSVPDEVMDNGEAMVLLAQEVLRQ